MICTLYETPSFDNVIDKVLTQRASYSNCTFLEPYNEQYPIIRLRAASNNLDNVNYLKLSVTNEYERYYFIRNKTFKKNRYCLLTCELDLLMTYKDWINSLEVNIVRTDALKFGEDGSSMDTAWFFNDNYAMGDMELLPSMGRRLVYFPKEGETSLAKGIAGFVAPEEPTASQRQNGIYILTTIQNGYHRRSSQSSSQSSQSNEGG